MSYKQVQCTECFCALYFTEEDETWGITGELCYDCQREQETKEEDDD
ncbi:hypothetical protein MACH09_10340 [Vibrio sp. MACH09]|nr:hypothetical protein [Vibrio sp. MACH09]GLO60526.1 hypothetical protein MACH09_10340 [Vibrio sp. MACH09]